MRETLQRQRHWKVTLLDNPVSNLPFTGGYVILHGEDNRSVERWIRTDHTGMADFGNAGRTRATITIAYELTPGYGGVARQIRTFQNVRVGDTTLYVYRYENELGDPIATIDVTLTDVLERTDRTHLLPFNSIKSYSGHNLLSEYRDVKTYELHIQKDGKVSLLAGAFERPIFPGNLLKYGFLLDQELVEGAEYEIPIDQEPISVNWHTKPSKALGYFTVIGE